MISFRELKTKGKFYREISRQTSYFRGTIRKYIREGAYRNSKMTQLAINTESFQGAGNFERILGLGYQGGITFMGPKC